MNDEALSQIISFTMYFPNYTGYDIICSVSACIQQTIYLLFK